MQKWEYCRLGKNPSDSKYYVTYYRTGKSGDASGFGSARTQLGLDGWELVGLIPDPFGGVFYFKRPIP